MLIGQLAALTALIWWSGLGLTQVPDVTSDGVALILIVCISTPIQVFVLALMARQTGASATNYLGLKLAAGRTIKFRGALTSQHWARALRISPSLVGPSWRLRHLQFPTTPATAPEEQGQVSHDHPKSDTKA
jgi:hypothetical protein